MDDSKKHRLLQFKINQQLFGFPLSTVDRVIHYLELQSVPGMPDYYQGMMNIQGHHIPVMDLAKKLEIPHTHSYTLNTPIIICQTKQGDKTGFVVDEVIGIADSEQTDAHVQALLQQASHAHVLGDVHTEQGDTLLLNTKTLIQSEKNKSTAGNE